MIGKNIKEIRKSKSLSQYRLAKISNVNDGLLCRIENDKVLDPRISTLLKIANALDVTVNDLIK